MTKSTLQLRPAPCGNLRIIVEELTSALTDAVAKDEKIIFWEQTRTKTKKKNNTGTKKVDSSHFNAVRHLVELVASLKACSRNKDLQKGAGMHDDIAKKGLLEKNPYIANTLVSMYAKCGALDKAKEVFDHLPYRNVVSWSALITGYVQQGLAEEALHCFEKMQSEGILPDAVTYSCILKACGSIGALEKGEELHKKIARTGLLGKNVVLGTALVHMYTKCGEISRAWEVFEQLPIRNVVSWSVLIAGYAQNGHGEEAVNCYEQMQQEGLFPNAVTFLCILQACGGMCAVEKGQHIHNMITRQGWLKKDTVLGTALVDMYVKCGALAKAWQVLEGLPFRSIATWSAMIGGYAMHGLGEEALTCFEKMQSEGLHPNVVTFSCLLKACGIIGATEKGERLHGDIIKKGLLEKNVVLGTALVNMYVKCGALAKASEVHGELLVRDIVSWNILIAAYTKCGQDEEALCCFSRLQHEGLYPDALTLTCISKACGRMGTTKKQIEIHDMIMGGEVVRKDIVLGSAIVHMHAKCGALAKARHVLSRLPARNVFSWSALIAGYAEQGHAEEALNCFCQMQREGISPNTVIFASVLNACSHSGLVDEGEMHFTDMNAKYGIKPELEHYTCMVDLFSRAGHFDKAVALIGKMPMPDYRPAWSALLSACLKWGNVQLGKLAFRYAIQVDSGYIPAYVCMSNIFSAAGVKDDNEQIYL